MKFTGRILYETGCYHYYVNDTVAAIHRVKWDYCWMNGLGVYNGTANPKEVPIRSGFHIVTKQRNMDRKYISQYIKTGKRNKTLGRH